MPVFAAILIVLGAVLSLVTIISIYREGGILKRLRAGFAEHLVGFSAALLISTLSLLSIGFLIASLVPTARFAQPVGSLIFYPMLALSGLFFPIEALPPALEAPPRGCCR